MGSKRWTTLDEACEYIEQAHQDDTASPSEPQPPYAVAIRFALSYESEDSGVRYQKCGGGRRVIRKHIGGN